MVEVFAGLGAITIFLLIMSILPYIAILSIWTTIKNIRRDQRFFQEEVLRALEHIANKN